MPSYQKCLWCNEIKCNHCRCLSSDDKQEDWTCITHEPGLQCPNNKANGRYKCNSCTKRRGRCVKKKRKLMLANQIQVDDKGAGMLECRGSADVGFSGVLTKQQTSCNSKNEDSSTRMPMPLHAVPYYSMFSKDTSNFLGNIPHNNIHGVSTAPAAPLLPTSIAQNAYYTHNITYMAPPYMMNPYYPHGPSSAMPMYNLPGTPYHNLMPPYNNTMHPMQPSFVSNEIGDMIPQSAPLPVGDHNSSDSLYYTHPDTRVLPNYNYGVINPIGSEGRESHRFIKDSVKSIEALSTAMDQSISTAMPLHPIDTGHKTKSSNDTLCRWCKKCIHTSKEMNEYDRVLLLHQHESLCSMYRPGTPNYNLMSPYNNTMHPMQPSFAPNRNVMNPQSVTLSVGEHNSSDSLYYTHPDTRVLPNYNYGVINPIGSEWRASHGNTKGNAKSIEALSITMDQSISTAMPLHPIDTGHKNKSSNDTLCRWCKKLIHTSNEMNEHDRELLRHQHESLCNLDNNSDMHGK